MKLKQYVKSRENSLAKWRLKTRLKNRDFTIISNNCWGTEVYKDLELPYTSPFVGLFLFAPCYLRLLKNLECLKEVPVFTQVSHYEFANEQRKGNWTKYPIGIIGENIEIHFMHYSDVSEAMEKWDRRVKRINWDRRNIFIKFCDIGNCTKEELEDFDKLDFSNKVCFTAKNYPQLKSNVWIKELKDEPCVVDGGSLYKIGSKYFDVVDWLNGGSGHVGITQRLINKVF